MNAHPTDIINSNSSPLLASSSVNSVNGITNLNNNNTNSSFINYNYDNFISNRSTLLQNLHSLHNLEPTPQDISTDFLYSPSNFAHQLIHIASQNIRGLSDATKQQHILNMINMRKIDIMGFSETKLTHKQASHIFTNLPNYHAIFHSHQNYTTGSGVGLLIHKDYAHFIHRIRYFNGRVITVDFLMKGKGKLRIIQLYTPTASPNNLTLRKSVDKFILDLLDHGNQNHFHTILMGDLNVNAKKLLQRKETNLM